MDDDDRNLGVAILGFFAGTAGAIKAGYDPMALYVLLSKHPIFEQKMAELRAEIERQEEPCRES